MFLIAIKNILYLLYYFVTYQRNTLSIHKVNTFFMLKEQLTQIIFLEVALNRHVDVVL